MLNAPRPPRPTAWGLQAWKRLKKALAPWRRILVVTHDYPDPDALAAGWAVVELARRKLHLRAVLAYGGELGQPENRAMVERLELPARELTALDFRRDTGVVLVDASPGAGNSPVEAGDRVAAVLDSHWRASVAGLGARLRRGCAATSTLAAELCWAAGLPVSERLATALYYGIVTDTQGLAREAAAADEAAFRALFPLVNHRLLSRIEKPRRPAYSYRMLHRALADARTYGNAAVAALGRLESREGPAEAADLLAQLAGVRATLAHGVWGRSAVFSVRTTRDGPEAWQLARAAAGAEGSAGGHRTVGGGAVPAGNARAAVRAGHRLERRFLRSARAPRKRGRKLV